MSILHNEKSLSKTKRLDKLQNSALLITFSLSLVILLAWMFEGLGAILPDSWSKMKANTALAILASVLAYNLLMQSRTMNVWQTVVFYSLVFIELTLTATALATHITGEAFSLNTLISVDADSLQSGLMSLQTASFFFILGVILALEKMPCQFTCYLKDALSMVLIGIIMVVLSGYLFQGSSLFSQSSQTVTSPHTLLSFILLTVVTLIHRSKAAFFSVLIQPGPGQLIIKALLPVAITLPFLVIGFALYGLSVNLITLESTLALSASVLATLLIFSVVVLANIQERNVNLLQQSEQQNRFILDTAAEGILGLDAHGNISFINRSASFLLQDTPKKLLGVNFHNRFHNVSEEGESILESDCPMCRLNKNAENMASQETYLWLGHNQTGFPVQYSRNLIEHDAQITGAVITFSDISERKHSERMKDEFIAIVSHELRTPLTSIKGSLGLIQSGKLGELPEKVKPLIDIASDNSERLNALINDLLDFNKVKLSESKFELISVNHLITKALEAMQGYAEKFSIVLVNNCPLQCDMTIKGDEQRLMQVFANLLSNAIKFSSPQSEVTVDINQINDRVTVFIRDTGQGIPAEYQANVFEKFSQADSSNTRNKGGTGLGLAITKEIIEKHGGNIGFKSKEGEGTDFYFDLPIQK